MKTQSARRQFRNSTPPHPLWMRLLTIFCMALLGVASTVQACHSHDEAPFTLNSHTPLALQSAHPEDSSPPQTSAVSCPICVAMHSALPVSHTLAAAFTLRAEPTRFPAKNAPRLFLWSFEQASRPPPAASPFA